MMKKIVFIADFYAREIKGGAEICDDILTDDDVERGTYNDGLEISSKKCKLISKRLKDAIDDGGVGHFIEAFNDMKKQAPKETCSICEGTGTRKGWEGWQSKKEWLKHHDKLEYEDKKSPEEQIEDTFKTGKPIPVGYKWAKECKGCNACHGTGKVNAFFCHYDIDENEVKRFLNFCENSGGFNIW